MIGIATIARCSRTGCERKEHCHPSLGLVGAISLPCGGTTYCSVVCPIVSAADERVAFGTDALPLPSPLSNAHHRSFHENCFGPYARNRVLDTTEGKAWSLAERIWHRLFLIHGRAICGAHVMVSGGTMVRRNNSHHLPLGACHLYYCAWLLSSSRFTAHLSLGPRLEIHAFS